VSRRRRWMWRLALASLAVSLTLLLVIVPLGGAWLVTHPRSRRDTIVPVEGLSFPVDAVEFASQDGIRLRGWWGLSSPPVPRSVIVFVHGLYRSRNEMVDRAAKFYELGYTPLLFDLRNHGESDEAPTTLGVREAADVCSAARYAHARSPGAPVVLWGVSLGAAASLLGARCSGATAVIADSSFLSVTETVRHHFSEIFHLPSFPVADLLLQAIRWRGRFALADGDVEAAVRHLDDVPVLFVTGGKDWRMPPEIAAELLGASLNTNSRILRIDAATHGRAWATDPEIYGERVAGFLLDVHAPPNP
jgi:uncharacterized protein